MNEPIKLTEYSHGAGCGCKISPNVLDIILQGDMSSPDPRLLVGNASRDDAAVYDIGDGRAVVSTTDFFMPIVDDAFDFGRIAATNAISDIYAMGGTPMMAIAVLGWPVSLLSPDIARRVVEGGRHACQAAGIPLAGGHSIDSPEPIFGLAVTGSVDSRYLKRNNTAEAGDNLYLTKPLGIGILTTAEKKQLLRPEHRNLARDAMCELNNIGIALGRIDGVTAMTDVTGFGLLGHLCEMCEGSELCARIDFDRIPLLEATESYRLLGCVPGGTDRNFASYGDNVSSMSERERQILCDPQTSGGLLVAVNPRADTDVRALAVGRLGTPTRIGQLVAAHDHQLVEIA